MRDCRYVRRFTPNIHLAFEQMQNDSQDGNARRRRQTCRRHTLVVLEFVRMSASQKLEFINKSADDLRIGEDSLLLQLLHRWPKFLMLDEEWVDLLLKEGSMSRSRLFRRLMQLLKSQSLEGFDFGCDRFWKLLVTALEAVPQRRYEIVQVICKYNPGLLGY